MQVRPECHETPTPSKVDAIVSDTGHSHDSIVSHISLFLKPLRVLPRGGVLGTGIALERLDGQSFLDEVFLRTFTSRATDGVPIITH